MIILFLNLFVPEYVSSQYNSYNMVENHSENTIVCFDVATSIKYVYYHIIICTYYRRRVRYNMTCIKSFAGVFLRTPIFNNWNLNFRAQTLFAATWRVRIVAAELTPRTLFYIIKRIYNDNYYCYQWIKSKCVRVRRLLLSVVDSISHVVSPPQCQRDFQCTRSRPPARPAHPARRRPVFEHD